jgi:hypothetical protein
MFDPTAFDNIKVVVEGAIYDRDLDGDILIIDREDSIDLAKMSRKFGLSFSMRHQMRNSVLATLTIESNLKNLAAELLEMEDSFQLTGAVITVTFQLRHDNDHTLSLEIQRLLEHIWGSDRTITQAITVNPLNQEMGIENKVTVHFNRLVREDQIEDLTEMIEYMIISIQELEKMI